MARTTLILAIIFIVMGVFSYFYSGQASVTALIPAFFGALYLVFALVAMNAAKWHKPMMIASLVLSVLAIGGTTKGLMSFVKWLQGVPVERLFAVSVQAAFCVLALIYLIIGTRALFASRGAGA